MLITLGFAFLPTSMNVVPTAHAATNTVQSNSTATQPKSNLPVKPTKVVSPTKTTASTTKKVASSTTAKAPMPNFLSCSAGAENIASCGLYLVMYAGDSLAGTATTFGALLVSFGLRLDNSVFSTAFVQTGYSIVLAIVNLCFVLGIIIIAISTIIRNETYGIKQALWKLIVMAILVNFGLVITGPIVGFADNITSYFTTAIVGKSASPSDSFVASMMNSMNVQAFNLGTYTPEQARQMCEKEVKGSAPYIAAAAARSGVSGEAGLMTQTELKNCKTITNLAKPYTLDRFWQDIGNLFMALVMSVIAAWTFFMLGVLLLVRFLALTILLVLLPIAWLTWVFPGTGKHFSTWWNEFIKWTFFPAIMTFFIYLGFLTETQIDSGLLPAIRPGQSSNGPLGGVAHNLGVQGVVIGHNFLNLLLIAGFVILGVTMGASMSGKAGETLVKGSKSAAGGVSKWAGKKTGRGGKLAWQKAGGHTITERLRKNNMPIVGKYISGLGRNMDKWQTNKKDLDEAMKKVPKSKGEWKKFMEGSHSDDVLAAALSHGAKEGWIDEKTKANGKSANEWINRKSGFLKRMGAGEVVSKVQKSSLSNPETREASRKIAAYQKAIASGQSEDQARQLLAMSAPEGIKDGEGNLIEKGSSIDAREVLRAKTEEIADSARADDKINLDKIFNSKFKEGSPEEIEQKAILKGLANKNPALVHKLSGKMNREQLEVFHTVYKPIAQKELKGIEDEKNALDEEALEAGISQDQKQRIDELKSLIDKEGGLKDELNNLKKSIDNERDNTRRGNMLAQKTRLENQITGIGEHRKEINSIEDAARKKGFAKDPKKLKRRMNLEASHTIHQAAFKKSIFDSAFLAQSEKPKEGGEKKEGDQKGEKKESGH